MHLIADANIVYMSIKIWNENVKYYKLTLPNTQQKWLILQATLANLSISHVANWVLIIILGIGIKASTWDSIVNRGYPGGCAVPSC